MGVEIFSWVIMFFFVRRPTGLTTGPLTRFLSISSTFSFLLRFGLLPVCSGVLRRHFLLLCPQVPQSCVPRILVSYTGLLYWGRFFVDRSTSIDCSVLLLFSWSWRLKSCLSRRCLSRPSQNSTYVFSIGSCSCSLSMVSGLGWAIWLGAPFLRSFVPVSRRGAGSTLINPHSLSGIACCSSKYSMSCVWCSIDAAAADITDASEACAGFVLAIPDHRRSRHPWSTWPISPYP